MLELFYFFISVLLIIACGIFVAAEFSFVTINPNIINHLTSKGDKKAMKVAASLKNLSTQLSGAQVGITLTNLALGIIAKPLISSMLEAPLSALGLSDQTISTISVISGVSIATFLTMLFGELVPKNIAIAKPVETATRVSSYMHFFVTLMKFPINIMNGSANFILRKFNIEPKEELASARSADEILSLVKRSAEKGSLEKDTANMIERSLEFDELTAIETMTPRVKMKTLHKNDSLQKLIDLSVKTGHSKFPVIGTNADDILGVIHIKQALKVPRNKRKTKTVKDYMLKPILMPSATLLDAVLNHLRAGGMQMAILIDEFGGTDGLVTMEDLVEELIGEVSDEHDYHVKGPQKTSNPNEWLISGLLRPDEIEEYLGYKLPEEEDADTIAGVIAHYLEEMPEVGDQINLTAEHDNKKFKVILAVHKLEGHRIDKIVFKITKEITK